MTFRVAWAIARKAFASIPWPVYAVAALIVAAYVFGHARYNAGVEDERARQEHAQAIALEAVRKQTRDIEAKERKRLEGVAIDLRRKLADASAIADRVVSDMRDGRLRLRDKFKCPAVTGKLPEAPAAAAGSVGESPGGLSNADAEFLIRFAEDADAVALKLQACQKALPK